MDFEFWSRFLLAALAVWRLGHLVAEEDGPWQIITRLRRAAGLGFWGQLMDCFYCLSLWFAAPFCFWVAARGLDRFIVWLALSGAASLLYRATARGPRLLSLPTGEMQDGMLRTGPAGSEQDSGATDNEPAGGAVRPAGQ